MTRGKAGRLGAKARWNKSADELAAIGAKAGRAFKKLWQDKEYKARMSAERRKRAKDPLFREKMSSIRKQYFQDHPEERTRISVRVSAEMRQRVKTSAWRRRVRKQGLANSIHVKRHWADPEARKQHIKSLRKAASKRVPSVGGSHWPFQQGWIATRKAGKVFCRSSWESALVVLLDESPRVEKFTVEPYSIKYKFQGIVRAYWPDFWIRFKNGQEFLVELKGTWRREPKRKTLAKIRAATEYCAAHGIEFKFFTQKVESLSAFVQ